MAEVKDFAESLGVNLPFLAESPKQSASEPRPESNGRAGIGGFFSRNGTAK
jgi:hypothetical protein